MTKGPTAEELEEYDRLARLDLAIAKRRKQVVVAGTQIRFKLELRGQIDTERERTLRTLINLDVHGKAYAPEEPSKHTSDLHRGVTRGKAFMVPIVFDLKDGTYRLDLEEE